MRGREDLCMSSFRSFDVHVWANVSTLHRAQHDMPIWHTSNGTPARCLAARKGASDAGVPHWHVVLGSVQRGTFTQPYRIKREKTGRSQRFPSARTSVSAVRPLVPKIAPLLAAVDGGALV